MNVLVKYGNLQNKEFMTMKLNGAYHMTEAGVEDAGIGHDIKGVYLLSDGERSPNNRLFVSYVGYTNNLRQSLIAKISEPRYKFFWYEEAATEHEALAKAKEYFDMYQAVRPVLSNLPKNESPK